VCYRFLKVVGVVGVGRADEKVVRNKLGDLRRFLSSCKGSNAGRRNAILVPFRWGKRC
jgi:hypothetical protein